MLKMFNYIILTVYHFLDLNLSTYLLYLLVLLQ